MTTLKKYETLGSTKKFDFVLAEDSDGKFFTARYYYENGKYESGNCQASLEYIAETKSAGKYFNSESDAIARIKPVMQEFGIEV